MMSQKSRAQTVRTTVGQLAIAYYEAALAELGDEKLAQRVATQMLQEALLRPQHRRHG